MQILTAIISQVINVSCTCGGRRAQHGVSYRCSVIIIIITTNVTCHKQKLQGHGSIVTICLKRTVILPALRAWNIETDRQSDGRTDRSIS